MADQQDELLAYYRDELTFLRRLGVEYARRYPKIAGRLELGPDTSPDPHVERLLEGFAFLTARIQRNLDAAFPELTTALLDLVAPQLAAPVPSMSIARLEADPNQVRLTTGFTVARDFPLAAQSQSDLAVRFRTAYDVDLWPLRVADASLVPTDRFDFLDDRPDIATVVRIELGATGTIPLRALDMPHLRFYLDGDARTVNRLHELLFAHCKGVVLRGPGNERVELPATAIRPVGFAENEAVLPTPPNTHAAYRLLQEYFAFPEKFFFADLDFGGRRLPADGSCEVLLLLDEAPTQRLAVGPETFQLGCTPIVNLHSRSAEPIRLDQRQFEYRVVGDAFRERSTEVHSILRVSTKSDLDDDTEAVLPYYSYSHALGRGDPRSFWTARRQSTGRDDLPGSETLISFVDLDFTPRAPALTTVFPHVLCTNRRLASQVPTGAKLDWDRPAPIIRASLRHKPTPQRDAPVGGETKWRLVSSLSLNHLSLFGGEEALRAFRELLLLYAAGEAGTVPRQVSGVNALACELVTRRVGRDAWRGFCQGVEVTLTLDDEAFVGTSAYLFGEVVSRYLALHASMNSFTQLRLKRAQRDGIWKTWAPRSGDQPLR